MINEPMYGGGTILLTTPVEKPHLSNTGFPFDDTDPTEFSRPSRGSSFRPFRHHLDDIAARHPEFAEHLRPWTSDFPSSASPFRQSSTERKRHPSGSCGDDDNRSQASTSSNESNNSHHPESERPPQHPTKEDTTRRPIPQYGLRNTVDLGQKQKQASFDEEDLRGQRSMSAPPDNRSNQPQQRFVSRVNIEPQPAPPSMGGNSSTMPKPNQQQQKPNVRHIPIFVEGRDEPILPKNLDETDHFQQHPQPEPNYHHQQQQPPHFFDQAAKFAGYHREPPKPQQQREHVFTQQNHPQSQMPPSQQQQFQQYQQQKQQQYQQQQAQAQQPQQQQQQQQPPPQPQVNLNDPILKIQQVQKDVNELMSLVDKYEGGKSKKDKQYLYLDEMLTRNLLKLDNIETEGKDTIRQARKEAIKCIEKCISILEAKVTKIAENANENGNLENQLVPENSESIQATEPMEEEVTAELINNQTNTPQQTTPAETNSEKSLEKMEVEPIPANSIELNQIDEQPKQTLEIGGVAKGGIQIQTTEENKEQNVTPESTNNNNSTITEESQKKKGKKSPKKKMSEKNSQPSESSKTDVKPMDMDQTSPINTNTTSPANNTSQNSNQETTPKNES